MYNSLEETAEKALHIASKIKVLENALKPLIEEYKAYKVKLEREMRLEGKKLVEVSDGKVSWVDKQMLSLDKERIKERLGVSDLIEFEKVKQISYVLITLNKDKK